jgi:hypothetical protein
MGSEEKGEQGGEVPFNVLTNIPFERSGRLIHDGIKFNIMATSLLRLVI